jgi:hypothetical protein
VEPIEAELALNNQFLKETRKDVSALKEQLIVLRVCQQFDEPGEIRFPLHFCATRWIQKPPPTADSIFAVTFSAG